MLMKEMMMMNARVKESVSSSIHKIDREGENNNNLINKSFQKKENTARPMAEPLLIRRDLKVVIKRKRWREKTATTTKNNNNNYNYNYKHCALSIAI